MATIENTQADFLAALLTLSDKALKNDTTIADITVALNNQTIDNDARKSNVMDTVTKLIYINSSKSKDTLIAIVNALDCLSDDRDSYLALIDGYALDLAEQARVAQFISTILTSDKVYNYQVYSVIVKYAIILQDSPLIEQAIEKLQSLGTAGGQQ